MEKILEKSGNFVTGKKCLWQAQHFTLLIAQNRAYAVNLLDRGSD